MEAAGAQTEMPPAKISIKEEAKCQGSSTKTTWIYVQRKRQSRVAERASDQGNQEPWVLGPVLPDSVWASSFFFLGLGSPSTSFGLH